MSFATFKQYVETYMFFPLDTWIGILSLGASVVFYFWQRKQALPTVEIEGYELIGKRHTSREGLEVTFRGAPVVRVTTTVVRFWNAGNIALKKEDFSAYDPLKIVIPEDVEVFEIKVEKTNPETLLIPLERTQIGRDDTNRSVPLPFDFLKQGEGFKIHVIHDGEPFNGLKVEGRFSGEGRIVRSSTRTIGGATESDSWLSRLAKFFGFLAVGSVGPYSFYLSIYEQFHWYHVFGYLFCAYLFIAPSVLFARAGPKGL